MKSYIVYINGVEAYTIKASNHNAAEKKAISMNPTINPQYISVEYTEL